MARVEAFITGLRGSGFASPAQVEMVIRTADGDPTRLAPMVAEVLANKVDLFVAVGFPLLRVARSVAGTVPIVAIDLEFDPLANGIAASLAHPGGNITGIFMDFPDFTAKWLELMLETKRDLSRIAILWDPDTGPVQLDAVQRAAVSKNIQFIVFEVRRSSDFEQVFASASEKGVDGVIMLSSPVIAPNVQMLSDFAVRHRLPAITLFPDFARAGGLLAYGPNLLDLFRQLGVLSGKVLQGTKPADLPIERPTKFETVLNLRTAKTLGLDISPALLLRADEVIE